MSAIEDDKVRIAVQEILGVQSLEEAFANYIEHSDHTEENRLKTCRDIFQRFLESMQNQEKGMLLYIRHIHKIRNSKQTQLLLSTLESMVENNTLSPKLVCEIILACEQLTLANVETWCQMFALMHNIIGGVDYKGCRDLLKVILEKLSNIPQSDNISIFRGIEALKKVVLLILNRNACLLPAYFAINEITKIQQPNKLWPHWILGKDLADFMQSFRPVAQMLTTAGRSSLLPIVGHSSSQANMWKLNPAELKFPRTGPLPYDKELYEPQTKLLQYVLEQPYSRDMVCNILSLNRQTKYRCIVLEEQVVELVVVAMEKTEEDGNSSEEKEISQLLWQHLSSQLIYFVLFQFASFPHMVMSLYDKLKGRELRKGRDHLMWVLLQFISGSIQKNPLNDFLPVLKLYDLLYPEKTVLDVPDINNAQCTHKMAVTSIWIHLDKKAQTDCVKLHRPMPNLLKGHLEFLETNIKQRVLPMTDFRIALLCNAYSTNSDYFSHPMGILIETIYGTQQNTTMLPGNIQSSSPTQPLPMRMLDSLTVHAKMSLIHGIVSKVIRLAQNKSPVALAPALVETYSRLLVYMEIESLGIKGFISQLLPNVFKSHAWGILHTLLEMFSYRLHHIQPHYRVQLLSHLHSLASVPQTNQNQLHLCVESTALRLITGLGSSEVQPQLSRLFNESKNLALLSGESEELNRALVLTLARALQVTGSETMSASWCKEIMTTLMKHTPHGWSSHTLSCFPPALQDFFNQNAVPKEDKQQLKQNVELEYRKWKSMTSEADLIAHFSMAGSPPLFLCILWKAVLEDGRFNPVAYKVLDRLGPRTVSAHLRTFADFLVFEFTTTARGQQVNKCVEALNDMIWKCSILSVDRIVLTLALRSLEGNEAQICLFIIQLLLLKPAEFRERVVEFVGNNSPEHWLESNWHERHMEFHLKFPEKFYYNEGMPDQSQHQYLPIYFGNVCLRFIPVFDIIVHRFLELPPVSKSLETILDHLGGLYKFHDRPITYLYNTLHYYEKRLKERPGLKRKLVQTIIGAMEEIRPTNWCLSQDYLQYMQRPPDDINWIPEEEYYMKLVARLVNTVAGNVPSPFPGCDWRFNEFPNPAAHALHATCVELMALPVASVTVGNALLDLVLKGCCQVDADKVMSWMNAIGLILTALPESYWCTMNEKILEVMQSATFANPSGDCNPFQMLNFSSSHAVYSRTLPSDVLALCHAVWIHASTGQLNHLPGFVEEKLKPVIKTEEQFIYLCHLVGPFLQRLHTERTRCLLELTKTLYEVLLNVDKSAQHLHYIDPICDFLYHIKYMFIGDGIKNEIEKLIKNYRPPLQLRLRFICFAKEDATPTQPEPKPIATKRKSQTVE
ncbi:unnamed protein product [Owenia fusiformis]|uniref:Mediator of RNA polymerase II transcription subunit 23 n=1 Tax=Owenia fusiformis TaxID=6347 RepID=A0A8J1Y3P2_OWEFU|nr:unnamed protein product [Owenia fusiformis]